MPGHPLAALYVYGAYAFGLLYAALIILRHQLVEDTARDAGIPPGRLPGHAPGLRHPAAAGHRHGPHRQKRGQAPGRPLMSRPLPEPCAAAIVDGEPALTSHRRACRYCQTRDVIPGQIPLFDPDQPDTPEHPTHDDTRTAPAP